MKTEQEIRKMIADYEQVIKLLEVYGAISGPACYARRCAVEALHWVLGDVKFLHDDGNPVKQEALTAQK